MKFSRIDYSVTPIKEFRVSASKLPSEKELQPQVYTANIFAKNSVFAQARLLQMLNQQYKIKSRDAVVLETKEIEQARDFTFKNFGISYVYRKGSEKHDGYKEVRHMNRALAVAAMYQEFGSCHKIPCSDIFITEVKQLKDEEVTKVKVLSYLGKEVAFPVFHKIPNTKADVVPANQEIFT